MQPKIQGLIALVIAQVLRGSFPPLRVKTARQTAYASPRARARSCGRALANT